MPRSPPSEPRSKRAKPSSPVVTQAAAASQSAPSDSIPAPDSPASRSRPHHCSSLDEYKKLYAQSIADPVTFWDTQAKRELNWLRPYDQVMSNPQQLDCAWFLNGQLNAADCCLDRHIAAGRGAKTALIWEADNGDSQHVTYDELLRQVCQCANALTRMGVRRGDTVCIYMPMVVAAVVAMLACARIGAPHSVVFAGFSSTALADRIVAARSSIVITADEARRGGRSIALKKIADAACEIAQQQHGFTVRHQLVYQHPHASTAAPAECTMQSPRDCWWSERLAAERTYCPCEPLSSEIAIFSLFSSGSTGAAKGIQHSLGGYLLYAALTAKYTFDLHEDDVHACVADVGWITGHSYLVYGPLCLGVTTLLFESTPLYPTASRYWELIAKHRCTTFYTSPTAIRALMKYDAAQFIAPHDLSSLRVIGSVGEPIGEPAWHWLHEHVGRKRVPIVDTYWQTETSGHLITSLPFATPMKPGCASLPFFGIEPVLLDPRTGARIEHTPGKSTSGVLCIGKAWPGMLRTLLGDHTRFVKTYLAPFPGYFLTADGCTRDGDGYLWITGRVDDVLNVSGHRIGSAEIENALVGHPSIAEAAVCGVPHDIKGQSLFAYVTAKDSNTLSNLELTKQLIAAVRSSIGPFAAPDTIVVAPALSKTRSGKILRRLLRKIAEGVTSHEEFGDISTLADESVLQQLIDNVAQVKAAAAAAAVAAKQCRL